MVRHDNEHNEEETMEEKTLSDMHSRSHYTWNTHTHTHSDTDDSSSFASLQLCTNKRLDTVYAQSVSAFANKYLNVETPVVCNLELFLFMWLSGLEIKLLAALLSQQYSHKTSTWCF